MAGAARHIDLLHLEDSATDRLLTEAFLRRASHEWNDDGVPLDLNVHSESTLHGAEKALVARRFDAILVDLGLPDAHGLEVIHRLKATGDVPIIVVSGNMTRPDILASMGLGVADCIPKEDQEPDRLLLSILAALRRVGALDAPRTGAGATRGGRPQRDPRGAPDGTAKAPHGTRGD